MNPDLDLTSVLAKLRWADTHFKAVDAEIHAWLEGSQSRLIHQQNAEFTEHYLVASIPGPKPDFERWSLMIGDCITNLRDTLDHIVYAIACLPTSPAPDKRDKTAFLVTTCEKQFWNWGKTKLASVPDAVRQAMLRFQPFNRPHEILPPLIGILAELANGNKHRILNLAITTPGIAKVEFISQDSVEQDAKVGINTEDIEDGTVVFFFKVDKPDPSITLGSFEGTLHVVIRHTPRIGETEFGADRTPYRLLIQMLFAEVGAILDELADATN